MGNNSNGFGQKYIVGIDFGTEGIGYAYYRNQCSLDINPFLSYFKGQVDNKVSNEIIFDNNINKVLAFGNECSIYINSHRENPESYEYFKDIKMNLYERKYFIKSNNEKEVDIEKIITKILIYISDHAINQIGVHFGEISLSKTEIKWVVTIPAIWEEESKQIMINASKSAGLVNNNTDLSLFLALEPEAAGIFYFSNLNTNLNEKDREIQLNRPFIICDIGAGTVDICALRKEKDKNSLIEEYPPLGGNYGGNFINKEFINKVIIELFGKDKFEKVKKEIEYKDFEKEIEKIKRELKETNYNCHLNCRIFQEYNNSLNNYIYEYNKKNKYILKRDIRGEWELLFPNKILLDITKDIAKKIFLKLEEVHNNVKNAQIIFTGAGSNNEILIKYIQNFFEEKNILFNIRTTIQPEISILKGAVLYGFQSNIIRKRKSKYTIGVRTSGNWDDKLHNKGGLKIFNDIDHKYKCSNLFKKYITRNEYIEFDKIIAYNFIANVKHPKIHFYKSLRDNCTFINEKDEKNNLIIKKFGEVIFDIEDFNYNEREIRINIKMGGTYINITAEYLKNHKTINTTIHFEK